MMNQSFLAGALATLLLCAPHRSNAQPPRHWKLTPLLPSTITLPDGLRVTPGNPVPSGNTLTFNVNEKGEATGIYRLDTLENATRIADTHTSLPNREVYFHKFEEILNVCGDQIAFSGASSAKGETGIFLSRQGRLSVVADNTMTLPGSDKKIISASLLEHSQPLTADHLIFRAGGAGISGLYGREKDGKLIRLVDNSMTVPGATERFRDFSSAQANGGRVAFINSMRGSRLGAYLYEQGKVSVLANDTTPVPVTNTTFIKVFGVALSESRTIFAGFYRDEDQTKTGIYEKKPGGIRLLLDMKTLLPPDADYSYLPSQLMLSGDTMTFLVTAVSQKQGHVPGDRLFVNRGGITETLIERGDEIEDKKIDSFSPLRFEAGRLVLLIFFSDRSFGYYIAERMTDAESNLSAEKGK